MDVLRLDSLAELLLGRVESSYVGRVVLRAVSWLAKTVAHLRVVQLLNVSASQRDAQRTSMI